ncbi:hypothetical protein EGR_11309 [Echinococcus granulosus]|uniref:Uncharacterized protein n=1 Tax=Echinococcus granulosus TaxID=6210 RepID=W6TYH1_ECHGR|nr:hypothetical protein EGR_11309 [Echinococcus granulosus]EUB53840.1 hypothetical protein EGR_11309 [Echinococcus granulosus]
MHDGGHFSSFQSRLRRTKARQFISLCFLTYIYALMHETRYFEKDALLHETFLVLNHFGTMVATCFHRVFLAYGSAVLLLICCALIVGTAGQQLADIMNTSMEALKAYQALQKISSIFQGENQNLADQLV